MKKKQDKVEYTPERVLEESVKAYKQILERNYKRELKSDKGEEFKAKIQDKLTRYQEHIKKFLPFEQKLHAGTITLEDLKNLPSTKF